MSTSNANSFECPTCGAALQPNGTDLEIKCPYCGNVVIVPESLRVNSPRPANVFGQGTSMPPENIVAIEELIGEARRTNAQQFRSPQPAVVVRRRTGCGCFGCLSFVAIALIIILIGLGVFVAVAPGQVNQLLTQVNGAVKPAVADISTFSVDPSQVPNNGIVTFRWGVNITDSSTSVSLDRIANGTTVTVLRALPSVGNYSLAVQGKPGDKITFKLVTTRNGASTDKSVVVTIR